MMMNTIKALTIYNKSNVRLSSFQNIVFERVSKVIQETLGERRAVTLKQRTPSLWEMDGENIEVLFEDLGRDDVIHASIYFNRKIGKFERRDFHV